MSSPKATIYIVEDNPSFRRSVERLVRASGFEAQAFDSANAFLSNAVIRHPACILLDVRLPDVEGLAFHRTLREKGYTLPVIFMTGHGTIPMVVQAIQNGAIDFHRALSDVPGFPMIAPADHSAVPIYYTRISVSL